MQTVFENAKQKYIQLKGNSSYTSLYSKISRSDALTEICGISVRRGLPPTVGDFTYKATMMPSIYFTFDNAKSAMAALIMLKIWDERVNSTYHFCSSQNVRIMALHIVAESIYLH
jgi:hypothetical protein